MPGIFLQEEFVRIPIAIHNSWPYTCPTWLDFAPLFMADAGAIFDSMDDRGKTEYCNTQLRFHMSNAKWHGRWRTMARRPGQMPDPPHGVPELALISSLTFMARAIYGAAVYYGDLIHGILTVLLVTFCTILAYNFINEDAPIFVGWRTLSISNCDVDQVQLSTRTVHSHDHSSFYRLSVIYSRFVWGTLVFRRKHSEAMLYRDLLDMSGRFDALKFEEWIRAVIYDAMTVPYGSVWNFRHLTLT